MKAVATTREFLPDLYLEPLIIFSITLQGMNPEENPGRMVYDHLWAYMRGNVAHVALNFNFESSKGIASYGKCLNTVLDHLENGGLKE